MTFEKTALDGVWLITPRRFGDARGYFMESFREDLFREHIGDIRFVQDNESVSSRGVLRGLHYQKDEASQAKLVRVSRGAVLDVAVDLRRSSPTFLRHIAVELSADNGRQLYIPRGFAHGFLVLSVGNQDTIGFFPAAPHAAPKLVELGKAVAFRVLNQHDDGVRHVHADLHHRCGY